MTGASLQLLFSAFFGVAVVAGALLVMLPEASVLQTFHPIGAWMNRIIAQNFPLQEDGQIASQPEPIPVRSQPAVRIVS